MLDRAGFEDDVSPWARVVIGGVGEVDGGTGVETGTGVDLDSGVPLADLDRGGPWSEDGEDLIRWVMPVEEGAGMDPPVGLFDHGGVLVDQVGVVFDPGLAAGDLVDELLAAVLEVGDLVFAGPSLRGRSSGVGDGSGQGGELE